MNTQIMNKQESLKLIGLNNTGYIYWNLTTPVLYEEAIRRHEGMISHLGPFVMQTGRHTGRLPKDKFFVKESSSEGKICWGDINRPFDPEKFEALKRRVLAYFQGKDLFIEDCYAGADEQFRIPIRVVTEGAAYALFARNMFLHEIDQDKLDRHVPGFTILHAPNFHAEPELDGTHSDAFIIIHFAKG